MNDLVERPVQPLIADPTPMLLIQRAMDSGIDPGKLYELAQQWEADRAAERFAVALATFQARCPVIVKEREIRLKSGTILYASLDDIIRQIKPLLSECGISITFSAGITDKGMLTAKCRIHHWRHVEESEITLPVPAQMQVNDTQKMGAALSYAKRYALCAALNIIVTDEDADGEGLVETISQEQIATLDEWLSQLPAGETPKFLTYMGAASLSEIPEGDFKKGLVALQKKAKAAR